MEKLRISYGLCANYRELPLVACTGPGRAHTSTGNAPSIFFIWHFQKIIKLLSTLKLQTKHSLLAPQHESRYYCMDRIWNALHTKMWMDQKFDFLLADTSLQDYGKCFVREAVFCKIIKRNVSAFCSLFELFNILFSIEGPSRLLEAFEVLKGIFLILILQLNKIELNQKLTY